MSVRKATQLPYHYLKANNMKQLKITISNLDFFRVLFSNDVFKPKLLSWWCAVPGGVGSAVEAYEQSLSNYISTRPPQEEKYKLVYQLAHFCKDIQDYKRAEAYMKQASNIADTVFAGQPVIADVLMDLVRVMSLRYSFAGGEEEALLKKALTIRKTSLGELTEPVADTLEVLAKFYRGRREYYSAELFFQQAIKIREKMRGVGHPSLATALTGMAWVYQRQHKFKMAIELGSRLIELLETAYGSSHPEVATAYTNYGLLLNSQDQMTKASVFLKAAFNISEQLYGKESKNAHQIRVYLVNVYTKMKKTEDIKALAPLIAQYEEDSDSQPSLGTINSTAAEDESKAKVIKVTLGNDLDLLDEEDSSGKTPGEVQKNRNRWTIFVRSPDPDFAKYVASVEFRFHPDWTTRGNHKGRLEKNIVQVDQAPFIFSNIGWPPIHGLPKEHREDLFKTLIVITFNDKLKCEPVQIPYELVLPVKTEMATTETTGSGREIEYEFIQENGRAYFVQFLGKSAADPGGWIDRL